MFHLEKILMKPLYLRYPLHFCLFFSWPTASLLQSMWVFLSRSQLVQDEWDEQLDVFGQVAFDVVVNDNEHLRLLIRPSGFESRCGAKFFVDYYLFLHLQVSIITLIFFRFVHNWHKFLDFDKKLLTVGATLARSADWAIGAWECVFV